MSTQQRHRHAAIAVVAADLEAHALALDEECPYCGAPSGVTCTNLLTGLQLRACHWQRIYQATNRTEGPVT